VSRRPVEIVASAVEEYGSGREAVLQILTRVNGELGYIPEEAMKAVAAAVGVSDAEVYGVVSFYSFLSVKPRGRNIIRICDTVTCGMKGFKDVVAAIEEELGVGVGETTPDGRVSLETTSCLGLCDQAPAMLVNDTPYIRLTPEEARRIVAGLE